MKQLQRLRSTRQLRDMLAETTFNSKQLIQPLFIVEGLTRNEPIASLRGNVRLTAESSLQQVEADLEAGVENFIIFFVPQEKKAAGFQHDFSSNVLQKLSSRFGKDAFFWVDTCLCSKTDSGHCCLFTPEGAIDFEATHNALTSFAVACADAGAHGIAPSDMIDGRVAALREGLNKAQHHMIPIMSYSTKFQSSFYGPFRDAADSAPQFGDRKQYQLDVRNRSAALQASIRCAEEGADLLMVKPGMTSIDLIEPIKQATGLQVGAYQVSGEFGGLSVLADQQLMNFDLALMETWYTFRRAGAAFVITYGARMAKRLGL
jgi:porphobilinogen synthase